MSNQRKASRGLVARNSMGVGYSHPRAVPNAAGQVDHTQVHADLGKPPLPKKAFTEAGKPEVHSAMMGKSRKDGTHFAGLSGQDLSRYDADAADPLSAPPRGKKLSPLVPSPGMRDRFDDALASGTPGAAHATAMAKRDEFTKGMTDMADRVLTEAGDASAPDDRRALRIGTLKE